MRKDQTLWTTSWDVGFKGLECQDGHAVSAQVCTGVMLHGYPLVKSLCGDLQARPLYLEVAGQTQTSNPKPPIQ